MLDEFLYDDLKIECEEKLKELEPGSEEYRKVLENLKILNSMDMEVGELILKESLEDKRIEQQEKDRKANILTKTMAIIGTLLGIGAVSYFERDSILPQKPFSMIKNIMPKV